MTEKEMWKAFCQAEKMKEDTPYEAWCFGADPDGLAALVLEGKKTATASAYELYEMDGEEIPKEGSISIILDSKDQAVCVIRDSKVYVEAFNQVSERQAFKEGEGDRSLSYWRAVHEDFFREDCEAYGLTFREDMPVVCEEFEVLYPLEEMELIAPSMALEKEILAFRDEFVAEDTNAGGLSSLKRMESVEGWIRKLERYKDARNCPEGIVPATQYLYVRKSDGKIVGMIQIRHYLNDYLRAYSGHIGYGVAPSERRRGYASRMLKGSLSICKALGIDDVMIACTTDNEGSRRTIEKNGGIYDKTVYMEERDVHLMQYYIHLGE